MCHVQIPEVDLAALQPKKPSQHKSSNGGEAAAPGTIGSTAIARSTKAPELQFGEVQKRNVGDAVALRKQLGAM